MSKTIKDELTKNKKNNNNQATQFKKNKKSDSKNKVNNFILFIKRYLTKVNITYFVLFLIDIILVIYLARQNIVNYAVILDEEVFVSRTRYLLWGRNYINLITTFFFYVYICLVNKFFLHRKNTKKFLGWMFAILAILNLLLFVIFTKKIY